MSIVNIVTALAAFANLALGLVVLIKGRRRPLEFCFFLFGLIDALWVFSNFWFAAISPSLFVFRSQYALGSLVLVTALPWTFYMVSGKLETIKGVFIALTGVVLFVLAYTDLIISSITTTNLGGSFEFHTGPLFTYYGAIFLILLFYLLFLLASAFIKATGLKKMQLRYILIGISTFATISILFGVVLPIFNIRPVVAYDAQSSIIWVALAAYTIVAHQLFDIRVIIKRTVVYSGLLLFAVLTYSMCVFFFATLFGGENIFSSNTFLVNLFSATAIAVGFEPLRKWLVRVTDKYLFIGTYNAQEVIAELAQTLSGVLDLDEALQSMMRALVAALRAKSSAAFIISSHKDDEDKNSPVKRVQSVGYDATAQKDLTLEPNGPIMTYFTRGSDKPLVYDDQLDQSEQSGPKKAAATELADRLKRLGAAVALPIKVKEKLIGILIIGPKLSGDTYSTDDLQFLEVVASQTASAIEKSRFYEDDQLKSEFVSIASHELLTPTAAIEGYLSMILDEKMAKVDPKAEEYLRKVQSSAHRLAELVADLLSVSRIEGGRIVINKQPIEVSPVITRVIDEIGVKATQAEIKLEYIAPEKPLPKALADPERVAQIVTNLISNSIKYNKPKGTITVTAEADNKFVTVHVKDSGIGIAPNHIPHLFEKFYRVHDDSAAAEKVGTGLGLYITRSIVELQGGSIKVESEAGKGSTFSFTMPLA